MFMPRSPADELANLRNRIAELRAREAALEARFIEMNDEGRHIGYLADVIVERRAHDVFDITKLPPEIQNDPRFHTVKHVTSIRVEPRDTVGIDAFLELEAPGSDFEVIEHD